MKLKYRKEIDALRGISILAVLFHHLEFEKLYFFSGGYLGVDIFFVISGYLITSIIIKEIDYSDNFSFKSFYIRRIRRLFPALLFMLICVSAVSYFFLLPKELIHYLYSLLSSIFYFSNFFFHYSGIKYGALASETELLIHTWSLSIEEQFYIFFPIIFYLFYRNLKNKIIIFIVILFLISLIFSTSIVNSNPSFNFYMLFSRIFELSFGSILALVKLKQNSKITKFSNYLVLAGTFLIFFSFFYFSKDTLHPSLLTLIPVIGSGMIIFFYNDNSIFKKLFTNKYLVYIGLISYSLYLWHWPVLAITKNIIMINDNLKFFLLVVILTFSVTSYYLVEKPFRENNISLVKKKKIVLIFFSSLLIIFSYSGIKSLGFPNRFPEFIININNNYDYKKNSILNFKVYGNSKNNKNIVLVGDSHAQPLGPNLSQISQKLGYNYSQTIKNGCPIIINLNRVNKKNFKIYNNCDIEYQNKRINYIKGLKGEKIVVIMGHYSILVEEQIFELNKKNEYRNTKDFYNTYRNNLKTKQQRNNKFKKEFLNLVKNLTDENIKVILIYPMLEMPNNVPREIIYNLRKKDFFLQKPKEEILDLSIEFSKYKTRNKFLFEIFDKIKNDKVKKIYPHKLFCNNYLKNHCIANIKNKIFFRDSDHLSETGANLLAIEIEKSLNQLR